MGKFSKNKKDKFQPTVKKLSSKPTPAMSLPVHIEAINPDPPHPEISDYNACKCSPASTVDQRARNYAMAVREELELCNEVLHSFCESLHEDNENLKNLQKSNVDLLSLEVKCLEDSLTAQKGYLKALSEELDLLKLRKPEEKQLVKHTVEIVKEVPKSYLIAMGLVIICNLILLLAK